MRALWTVVHRWIGLVLAGFLTMAGLTGAVLSWDHEIDEWLNADMLETPARGPLKTPLELAAVVEASEPRAEISYMTDRKSTRLNSSHLVISHADSSLDIKLISARGPLKTPPERAA